MSGENTGCSGNDKKSFSDEERVGNVVARNKVNSVVVDATVYGLSPVQQADLQSDLESLLQNYDGVNE